MIIKVSLAVEIHRGHFRDDGCTEALVRWCDNRRTRTLHSSEREERVGGPYFHLPRNLDTSPPQRKAHLALPLYLAHVASHLTDELRQQIA
jgi:hypothetical protein